jgi:hypothetical protein
MQTSQAFSQMSREPLQFRGESLLGQLDGILKAFTDSGLLLLVDLRVQGHEVVRRLDGRVRDFEVEQSFERRGVVACVEQAAETPLGLALDRVVLGREFTGGFLQFLS